MRCPKCNATPPAGAVFCHLCGKKLITTKKSRTKSRGNGTGTAFKRGGSWTAQVVTGWRIVAPDLPLRRVTRSKSGFRTRDEALRYCPVLKSGPQKPKEAPTLEHYYTVYQSGSYKVLSPSTKQAYRTAWKKLDPLRQTQIDQITVSDLQQLVAEKAPSFDTAKDMKELLTHLFDIAAAEGYVRREIPSFITLPKLHEKEKTPFSETEQAAIWKVYESGDIRAAIPLLMIYTGIMPGEAMRLKVGQIDLDRRIITGAGMKTAVRRSAPIVLADCIVPVLQDLIDHAQPSGYLWKRVEKKWYADYYAVLDLAGCRRLTPYSCRHTTATALAITEGIAPQTIRKVMRWSSTRMLDRYAHPDRDDALEAVNSIKTALR